MSDSESAKERAARILSEALDDASVYEGHTSYTWEHYFDGRIEVYWERRADDGINFVLNSIGGDGEELRCRLDLEPISQSSYCMGGLDSLLTVGARGRFANCRSKPRPEKYQLAAAN